MRDNRCQPQSRAEGLAIEAPTATDGFDPILVIDVEVRSDEIARRLARRARDTGRRNLREIVCVSCLSWNPGADPCWRLRSFHLEEMSEADILENAHQVAKRHLAAGGVLVTFNGTAHDIPLLRSRQVRWWQCDRAAFKSYQDGAGLHVDVMLGLGAPHRAFPALTDACASIGIPLHGAVRVDAERELPAEREKCERDVIGTAILYFYVLADRVQSNQPLIVGLASLGQFLRERQVFNPHLRTLAGNPALQGVRRPWGA